MKKNDIQSREDIETFMSTFYETILDDEVLKPKFDDIDLEEHLPTIVDFWESVLLHKPTYSGSPFPVHVRLKLETMHFDHWLNHFNQVIDSLYSGTVATNAKTRAVAVAEIFKSKLNLT